jgi:hypothetical protein
MKCCPAWNDLLYRCADHWSPISTWNQTQTANQAITALMLPLLHRQKFGEHNTEGMWNAAARSRQATGTASRSAS